MRGGEKVLETLCEMFPEAPLYTLLHNRGTVSASIERHPIHTSFLQRLPGVARSYRHYLPLYPLAVRQLDLRGYDFVISSSHAVAKSVRASPARHLCYCHSPMRYAWDQFDTYFGPERVGRIASALVYRPILGGLARWDAATASRVDRFVANSGYVAQRIRRYYKRDATVVHPPVDTEFFRPGTSPAHAHYLIVSALVPYKRVDLAIRACGQIGASLRIVGHGPEQLALQSLAGATGAKVTFLGAPSNEELRDQYRTARAVLLPGEEDFGIVPVEAQACGTPVVAFGRGGACETVVPGQTGLFFGEASPASLAQALQALETTTFDADVIRRHAERFSRARFAAELRQVVTETMAAPANTRW